MKTDPIGIYLNRFYLALLIAVALHLLFILLTWAIVMVLPDVKKVEPKEKKIKISLKEMPKKPLEKTLNPPKIVQKEPVVPQKKISQHVQKEPIIFKEEKIIPQTPVVRAKETPLNKQEVVVEKKDETPKVEPLPQKSSHVLLPQKETQPVLSVEPKEKKSKSGGFDWMYEDKTKQSQKPQNSDSKTKNSIGGNLKELYGSDFDKLTPAQKKYLTDNQETMRRITQEVLDRVARVNLRRDLNTNSVNVVEFYLHPNGDMSDFKFLKNSGYFVLDDTTKETIEYAYSRYPRPSEKILIRYNVFYNLAH